MELRLSGDPALSAVCWLGVLDGDGTVQDRASTGGPRMTWVGSAESMAQCAAFWVSVLRRPVPTYLLNRKASPLWAVTLSHCSAQHAADVLLASAEYSLPPKRRKLTAIAAHRSARVSARLGEER